MLLQESQKRQQKLIEHIKTMASAIKSEQELENLAIEMKTLYADNFRHSYSDFFPLILEMSKDAKNYNLEFLSNNLMLFRKMIERKGENGTREYEDLHDPLIKLSDHLNLEIARYNYYSMNEQRGKDTEKIISNIKEEIDKSQERINKTEYNIQEVERDLKQSTKDYITILGIFASIVLALTAGISFASSVFENIHQASIYRIALISLFIGLVMVNSLYALFYYIDRLVNSTENRSIKLLKSINTIFLSLIAFVVIAWMFGIVEFRDAFIC